MGLKQYEPDVQRGKVEEVGKQIEEVICDRPIEEKIFIHKKPSMGERIRVFNKNFSEDLDRPPTPNEIKEFFELFDLGEISYFGFIKKLGCTKYDQD